MKTNYDFAFCDGMLTPDVVFYTVPVGVSLADRRAIMSVRAFVRDDTRFFFARHSRETAEFINRIEASMFASAKFNGLLAFSYLRRRTVSIVSLARFLKRCPAALLNSSQIDTLFVNPCAMGTSLYRPVSSPVRCLSYPQTY